MKSWKWQNLKELVDSLTVNEKRYFTLQQNETKNKNYIKLFEAIQDKTDEKLVKKRLANLKINVSYEKSYLIKVILKNLRNFHEFSSLSVEFNQVLTDIELLLDKKLYSFCYNYVNHYIELALKTESHTYLLQLIKWKRKCIIRLGNLKQLNLFSEEERIIEEDCLRKMSCNSEIRLLQQKMLVLISQKGNSMHENDKKLMQEILLNSILIAPPDYLSIISQLMSLEIKIWGFYYSNNFQAAFDHVMMLSKIVEENEFIEIYNPQLYYATMANLFNRAYKLDKKEIMDKALWNIEKLAFTTRKNVSEDLKTEAISYVLERKLVGAANNLNFEEAINIFQENKKIFSKYKFKYKPSFYILQYYFAGFAYFHSKDYNHAVKCIKHIIDNYNDSVRYDYLSSSNKCNWLNTRSGRREAKA